MSHRGVSQAVLARRLREEEERRIERERCKQVRARITSTCSEALEQVRSMVEDGSASWVQDELNGISSAIGSHSNVGGIPDGGVETAEETVNKLLSRTRALKAMGKERKLSKRLEIDGRKVELDGLQNHLSGVSGGLKNEQLRERMSILHERVEDAISGSSQEASSNHASFVNAIREESRSIVSEDEAMQVQENVRRHVVSSLYKAMSSMEFVMDTPREHSGGVTVRGRLPSGRSASFVVDISGRMEFDFDGYPGRECEQNLDLMVEKLKAEFEVEATIVQRDWKNPDRISKGSKGFPKGGSSRGMGGGA